MTALSFRVYGTPAPAGSKTTIPSPPTSTPGTTPPGTPPATTVPGTPPTSPGSSVPGALPATGPTGDNIAVGVGLVVLLAGIVLFCLSRLVTRPGHTRWDDQ